MTIEKIEKIYDVLENNQDLSVKFSERGEDEKYVFIEFYAFGSDNPQYLLKVWYNIARKRFTISSHDKHHQKQRCRFPIDENMSPGSIANEIKKQLKIARDKFVNDIKPDNASPNNDKAENNSKQEMAKQSKVIIDIVTKINTALPQQKWWRQHKHLFVLNDDEESIIHDCNRRNSYHGHIITLAYPFEGLSGNPYKAKIVFLSHNPLSTTEELCMDWNIQQNTHGIPITDDHWNILEQERNILLGIGSERDHAIPSHCLNHIFCGAYGWWKKRLLGESSLFRKAWDNMSDGELQKRVANSIATLEIYGYHSSWFDDKATFPHTEKIKEALRQAIANGALIFLRSRTDVVKAGKPGYWVSLVPELGEYINAENSPIFVSRGQSPYFSENNIIRAKDCHLITDASEKKVDELKQEACESAITYLQNLR